MSSDSAIQQVQLLCNAIAELRSSNCATISALTILVYDVVITFDREYKHIWKAKWSLPKVLYIWIRYYGICEIGANVVVATRLNIPIDACKRYFWWTSIAGPIVFTTLVNIVLILRLHALYNRNRKGMLLFLCLTLFVELGVELYICVKTPLMTTSAAFSAPFGLPFTGCLTNIQTNYTLLSWIPCLIVAFIFFFMTAYQFFRTIQRLEGKLWGFWRRKSFSPMLLAFFRDGTVFFFVIAFTLLGCTLTTVLVRGVLQGVFLPWLVGTYSYAGSRLILQLREAARNFDGTTTWSGTITYQEVNTRERRQQHVAMVPLGST
ncbi:hypothetical protein BDQ17DRAFT_1435826 [Cyathus striatus]|nr:hypothetical protein BDQ17DRAFT_1435826 [Cyathus striatus]